LTADKTGVVLYLDGVPVLDAGGVAALERYTGFCRQRGIRLYLADLQFQPLKTLARAGVQPVAGVSRFFSSLQEALEALEEPGPAD